MPLGLPSTRATADTVVSALNTTIADALARDESAAIAGFRTFTIRARAAGEGRNSATGEHIAIAASTAPTFKADKKLRDTVNGPAGCPRPLAPRVSASIERRDTSFVRRGRGPRRHALVNQATIDSRSRRSANARAITVPPIRTVTSRDSHRHRVPCPCAEYHRAQAGQRAALGFRVAPAT